jgi:hypothetical protein
MRTIILTSYLLASILCCRGNEYSPYNEKLGFSIHNQRLFFWSLVPESKESLSGIVYFFTRHDRDVFCFTFDLDSLPKRKDEDTVWFYIDANAGITQKCTCSAIHFPYKQKNKPTASNLYWHKIKHLSQNMAFPILNGASLRQQPTASFLPALSLNPAPIPPPLPVLAFTPPATKRPAMKTRVIPDLPSPYLPFGNK